MPRALIVAPGIIDLDEHAQDDYGFKLLLRDGVTTPLEVEMGAYPVEDYYNQRAGKCEANRGASVSHLAVRSLSR